MPKKTFEQWMAEVNKAIEAKIGLSSDDLPDCPYDVWYEDGKSAKAAANKALKMAD